MERSDLDKKLWPFVAFTVALVVVVVLQQPLPLLIWLAALAYRVSRSWVRTEHRRLALVLGFTGMTLAVGGFTPFYVVMVPVLTVLLLKFATVPLGRLISRRGYSIRWKFEIGIALVAVLFLFSSLVTFGAMDFMHDELHDIQLIRTDEPRAMVDAVGELEDTQHSFLFRITPLMSLLGVPVAASLGSAMAWSVLTPVRGMGDAMRRLGDADFSQPVVVDNRDEMGELADHINRASTQLARFYESTQAELRGAKLIQTTLLPREMPVISGWDVRAHYQPARAVGGDFYDFIDLPEGRMGLVVADVSDKGVPAALVMATTRSVIRAVAERIDSPGALLQRVNDILYPDIPAYVFVTCMIGVLDPATGVLRFANAGHGLPYLWRKRGIEVLNARGMPLGLMPDMEYEEHEVTVTDGCALLFHSDGLVEAHNPDREMFGFPRLQRLVGTHGGDEALIHRLLEELTKFTGEDWEQEDDVTLVSLRCIGSPEEKAPTEPAQSSTDDLTVLTEFTLPCEEGNEQPAIDRIEEAIAPLSEPQARVDHLKTAVGEAIMNAIEHGNQYSKELDVAVRVAHSDEEIFVRIVDQGGGRPIHEPTAPDLLAKLEGAETPRGWGLFLIRNLVDDLRITSYRDRHVVELILKREGGGHAG